MKRLALAVAAALGATAIIGPAVARWSPVLLWNTTASAPLGFYRLQGESKPHVGDWVAVRPPKPLAAWLAARGFLPAGVPLLKRIAAKAPSAICRIGEAVTIDHVAAAVARSVDQFGRRLPAWSGCHRLSRAEVFLLNADAASLDSRYFGALPVGSIIGRATSIWTWEARR
jgi:type IV secretory pathway protease TraF